MVHARVGPGDTRFADLTQVRLAAKDTATASDGSTTGIIVSTSRRRRDAVMMSNSLGADQGIIYSVENPDLVIRYRFFPEQLAPAPTLQAFLNAQTYFSWYDKRTRYVNMQAFSDDRRVRIKVHGVTSGLGQWEMTWGLARIGVAAVWRSLVMGYDIETESFTERQRFQYSELLSEQTEIFDTQRDLNVLCTALRRLPHLKHISVLDCFADRLDFIPFVWAVNEFRWYHDWSAALCKGIASPSAWYDADMADEGTYISNAPWDFRGITNLLVAVEENAPHLRHLSLGCPISRLSAEIYGREENARPLYKIAPRLTSLKIDCDMPVTVPDLLFDSHVNTMKDIVQRMNHLKSLSLSIPPRSDEDFIEVFQNFKWPHLTTLDLADGYWTSDEIEQIANSHADTLRELRLRNVEITDGDPWEVVAGRLGQSLQLRMVCLMYLADHHSRYRKELSEKRVHRSARLFMKRTPDHLLGLKVEHGTAIAWQSHNFKPAYDLDRVLDNTPD
ncbi:MAG: hypothetical protein Q9212_002718 [Teloschistes hypoglaucus]